MTHNMTALAGDFATAGVSLVPGAAAAAKNRRLTAVYLGSLVFLVPIRRIFNVGGKEVNVAASDLLIPLGAAYLLVLLASRGVRLPLAGCFFASIASIGLSMVANLDITLTGKNPLSLVVEFIKILCLWIHFFLIVNLIKSRKDFLLALKVWILSSVMVAVTGIGGSLFYQVPQIETSFSVMYRGRGTLNDCNLYVVHLCVSMFVTLFYRRLVQPPPTWTSWVLPLQLVGMFFGVSRGGTLAFLASLAACWALCGFPRMRTVLFAGGVLALAAAVAVRDWEAVLGSNPMTARLSSTTISLDDPEAQQRRQLWKDALEGFKNSPVFGVGRGNFLQVTSSYPIAQAHNTFLGILCETGIVGFLTYAVFVGAILAGLIRQGWLAAGGADRIRTSLLLTSILAVLLGGVTISIENYRAAWLLLGMGVRYRGLFLEPAANTAHLVDQPPFEPAFSRR